MGEEKKCPCDAMIDAQRELRRHDERLADGSTNFALMNQSLETIQEDLTELKKDVKEIMAKPAHRWEKVVEYVLLAVIAAMLAGIGIGG